MNDVEKSIARLRKKVEAMSEETRTNLETRILSQAKTYDQALAIECPARQESTYKQCKESLNL